MCRDIDNPATRLETLKSLAAMHHSEMQIYKAKEDNLSDEEEISYERHTICFNALSAAIGLTQAVGRWRGWEAVPNKMKGITPLQKAVFRVHYSLVKNRQIDD